MRLKLSDLTSEDIVTTTIIIVCIISCIVFIVLGFFY